MPMEGRFWPQPQVSVCVVLCGVLVSIVSSLSYVYIAFGFVPDDEGSEDVVDTSALLERVRSISQEHEGIKRG
jgi:hypothetical protein